MNERKPLLSVRDLEVSFADGKKPVPRTDAVCFDVYPGEILAVVGESGCGKSVTALSILSLLDAGGRVTRGEILWEGTDLLRLAPEELDRVRGAQISMIFQDVMGSLNPVLSIGRQVIEPMCVHRGLTRAEAWEEAVALLDKTGIREPAETMHKYPHQLSGGQRQRVMIAMALSCRPKLLIADEPTTALDVTIQLQIMQLLRRLRDEMGMAILLITHDLGLVSEYADRVAVMYAGRIVEEAGCASLLSAPAHPYTKALLRSVPGLLADRSVRLHTIPGTVPEDYPAMKGCRFAPRCAHASRCSGEDRPLQIEAGHWMRCHPALLEGGEADG